MKTLDMHPNVHSRTFTITKTQKQPKCLSTDEWIHIYDGILLSHKKDGNNAICSNMDGARDCHAE